MPYRPKSFLEKFGFKVYDLLVDNFPRTFFVGGTARDILLKRKVTDIDIATAAAPDEVLNILKSAGLKTGLNGRPFGVIAAEKGAMTVEVASFRTEAYRGSRYPEIRFITNPKVDSKRRDLTVNSLYFSPKLNKILDFHGGQNDLKSNRLKFIGDPVKRIKEDPLRIIRTLRFSLSLDFKIDAGSFKAIKKNMGLLKNISENKKLGEINKLKNKRQKLILERIISDPLLLDKYFK